MAAQCSALPCYVSWWVPLGPLNECWQEPLIINAWQEFDPSLCSSLKAYLNPLYNSIAESLFKQYRPADGAAYATQGSVFAVMCSWLPLYSPLSDISIIKPKPFDNLTDSQCANSINALSNTSSAPVAAVIQNVNNVDFHYL